MSGTFVQPKIAGYRQLSEAEVALMNRAKALESQFHELIKEIKDHNDVQRRASGDEEFDRIKDAEPERWLAMGRTDIQTGVMKIVRSIAQPKTAP